MKTLAKILFGASLLTALAFGQQNTLVQTTLNGAINSTQNSIVLASATGVTITSSVQTVFYIDHEAMLGMSINGLVVTVQRGWGATPATAHATGEMVLLGRPDWFYSSDPSGQCTAATTYVTPYLNIVNGMQWLCSTIVTSWIPGFGNPGNSDQPVSNTAAVASAAGLITPSGPLFHITGALAITGFNIPVGFNATAGGGGSFCAIPDGLYTTTTANNIALASTGVINRPMCWSWDATNSKFVPSY